MDLGEGEEIRSRHATVGHGKAPPATRLRNFVFPALFLGVQLAELLNVFVTEKPES